jgi:threonine aldolase
VFAGLEGVSVDPIHSNIVFIDLNGPAKAKAAGLISHLESNGILATGLYRLRFVTHLDVNDADIDRACEVLGEYFA